MEEVKPSRIQAWKAEIIAHKYLILLSVLFFVIANILNYYAGSYADRKADVSVTDIILDRLPSINLSPIYVYGFVIMLFVGLFYALFFKVKELHVVISQFSLLVLVRSFFITLTHLKTPADAVIISVPKFYGLLAFQNDLFFSGHVSVAFLGFLLFRKEKLGIFYFIATIVMAVTVLLMHFHYSIDVFAAFFITYGTFKFGEWFFERVNHY